MRFICLCLISLAYGLSLPYASSQTRILAEFGEAVICPAFDNDESPPNKNSSECATQSGWTVDPQDTHIWAFFTLTVPDKELLLQAHYGLILGAKASSYIYINGDFFAKNGEPASSRNQEVPGKMDIIFPIKPETFQTGKNEIALRLSSHQGILHLRSPLHTLGIIPYQSPQNIMLRRYWPSLLPFGIFLLGGFYFAIMAVLSRQKLRMSLLSAMSAIISLQLLAEVSRGLVAYSYPMQDWRLVTILTGSVLFGLTLLAYIAKLFDPKNIWKWMCVAAILIVVIITVLSGMDRQASYSFLVCLILAIVISLKAITRKQDKAASFTSVLIFFSLFNFIGGGLFLDFYLYYIVAALMLFLFSQEAIDYTREQALRQSEESRANKLQYILDTKDAEVAEQTLIVKTTNKVVKIRTNEISVINGADDYTEIQLASGKSFLHTARLSELETQLPSYFLKVHRSHIVNTRLIKTLERNSAGNGLLHLTSEHKVPVSRRVMPSVRDALG